MLSILIPTYNYNVYSLVTELKSQADALGIAYEILVQDDASTFFLQENISVLRSDMKINCFFISNIGLCEFRGLILKKGN